MKILRRHPSPVWSLWSQKLCWFLAPFFREAAQTLGAASRDPEAIGNPLWSSLQHMPPLPWTRFIEDGQWCDTHHMDQMVSKCLSRVYRKKTLCFQLLVFEIYLSLDFREGFLRSRKWFQARCLRCRSDLRRTDFCIVWEQIFDWTMYFFKASILAAALLHIF